MKAIKVNPVGLIFAIVCLIVLVGFQNFGAVPSDRAVQTAQGGMFVTGNAVAQVLTTADVFEVVEAYDTVSVEDGVTVSIATNTMTALNAGVYICSFTITISGAQNTNLKAGIFFNGVATSSVGGDRITEMGDVASMSGGAFGFVPVSAVVDIRMAADSSSYSATVTDANLFCFRPLVVVVP